MRTVLALMLSVVLTVEARAALPRVASTTVCTDQYLLAIAAPEQIAGLSPDARDPALSAGAARARDFPVLPLNAESLLLAHPDIVLGESFFSTHMAPFLMRNGIRFEALPSPSDLAGVAQTLRQLGDMIGRPRAGEDAAQRLMSDAAALAAQAPAQKPAALYLLPTGTTVGAGAFIDEVMSLGGFSNLAAAQGMKGWGHVPLETLVETPPQIVIASFFDLANTTAMAGFAASPLARRTLSKAKVISIPDALWVCAGPMLIDAARALAAQNPAYGKIAP